jgi:hypothetical protein
VDGISVCNKWGFCSTLKACLVLPKIVSPLRGKPFLLPDPGTPIPTARRVLLPSLDRGRGEVEDFPDCNCKALPFDFPWWEEEPAYIVFGFSPDSKKKWGATSPTSPSYSHTACIILTGPPYHLPHELLSSGTQKAIWHYRVQKFG